MNNWAAHILWLISCREQDIIDLKKMLKGVKSETSTVPEPWASMTSEEIMESIGVYK